MEGETPPDDDIVQIQEDFSVRMKKILDDREKIDKEMMEL